MRVHQQSAAPTTWEGHLRELLAECDRRQQQGNSLVGISTGLQELDQYTGGLPIGDLTVVAHLPFTTCEWLLWNLAINAAMAQVPVVIYTHEMPSTYTAAILAGLYCDINYWQIRRGLLVSEEWKTLGHALGALENLPIHLRSGHKLNALDIALDIVVTARDLGGQPLIVIPHMDRVAALEKEPSLSAFQMTANCLRQAAYESNTAVLVGCPISSRIGRRDDPRPRSHDVRHWPSVEADAGLLLIPYESRVWHTNPSDWIRAIFLYGHGLWPGTAVNFDIDEKTLRYRDRQSLCQEWQHA